ncbi:MAG: hypothetical protein GY820_25475 [Gammaproteobacteria bacterium]|nr:hypothetical protein [Gammaproteobacteria bacterium]
MIYFSIQKSVEMAESQWDDSEFSFLSESGDTAAVGTTIQIKDDEPKNEEDDGREKEQPQKKIDEEEYRRKEEDGESSEN